MVRLQVRTAAFGCSVEKGLVVITNVLADSCFSCSLQVGFAGKLVPCRAPRKPAAAGS